ncbi:MAG: transposase [Candidatus Solibacter usitatus]|nr:transposase [Candidatus Solibacter usitatus]
MLRLFLERLGLLDRQVQLLDRMAAETMQPYEEAVIRLAEVPGFGPDSAQQTIAEVGAQAQSFASAAQFASWAGLCPGREESAEHNYSSRSPKGNPFLRRILTQAAQAAQAWLPCRCLGHRPQAGPPGLEDSSRPGPLYRTGPGIRSSRPAPSRQQDGPSTSQTALQG